MLYESCLDSEWTIQMKNSILNQEQGKLNREIISGDEELLFILLMWQCIMLIFKKKGLFFKRGA